mgnify:CR=1 FL=1
MIEGVIITPLKQFLDERGKVMHMLKNTDEHFNGFGEIYFSYVYPKMIKAWHIHKKMTLNYVAAYGKIKLVLYDDREKSKTNGNFLSVEISVENYQRLTVPPGVWLAFRGNFDGINLILNVANMEHDPDEVEKQGLEKIEYKWNAV